MGRAKPVTPKAGSYEYKGGSFRLPPFIFYKYSKQALVK